MVDISDAERTAVVVDLPGFCSDLAFESPRIPKTMTIERYQHLSSSSPAKHPSYSDSWDCCAVVVGGFYFVSSVGSSVVPHLKQNTITNVSIRCKVSQEIVSIYKVCFVAKVT